MIELRTLNGKIIFSAPAEGFDIYGFIKSAASAHAHKALPGQPRPGGVPSLAFADLENLRDQLRDAGIANALTPEGRLDLRGIKMIGYDLSSIRARNCDFTAADLRRVNLEAATLDYSKLADVDLSGAWMKGLKCRQADMRNVVMKPFLRPEGFSELHARCGMDDDLNEQGKDMTRAPGAMFDGSNMDGSTIQSANLSTSSLIKTSFRQAKVKESVFSDCVFGKTDIRTSEWTNNNLSSNTSGSVLSTGAMLRGNTYFHVKLMDILGSWSSKGRFRDLASKLPEELRDDALMSATLAGVVKVVSIALMAHGVPVPVLGAAGGKVAEMLHFEDITKEAAHKAMDETAKLGFGTSKLPGMLSDWLIGKRAVVAIGNASEKLQTALRSAPQALKDAALKLDGTFVVVGAPEQINGLLRRAGVVNQNGSLAGDYTRIERGADVGVNYPDEKAPCIVELARGGEATACWRDAGGKPLRQIRYDKTGEPISIKNFKSGQTYAPDHEEDPFFQKRRVVLEDFKEGLVRSLVPHDGSTHLAVSARDGSIVVRCMASGKVDNALGKHAVRSAEGVLTSFSQGVKQTSRNPSDHHHQALPVSDAGIHI